MKGYNNILYVLLILVAATFVGCEKTDLVGGSSTTLIEGARISVITESSNTKVSIDGTEVRWSDDDSLTLLEIGEDGSFIDELEFSIDANSISEDGKNAEFVSESTLTEGGSYIALHGYRGSLGETSKSYILDYSYNKVNSDIDIEEYYQKGWMMNSESFTASEGVVPQVVFTHKSSLLELTFSLGGDKEYTEQLSKIEVTSALSTFAEEVAFDAYGKSTSSSVISSISLPLDSMEISKDKSAVVKIPVTWNSDVATAEGDFSFIVTAVNGARDTITKPMQVLLDGGRYSTELSVDVSEFDPIANDKAALMDLYNATGGENWTSCNWDLDKPLSEWENITVDESGRVTEISMISNQLTGSLPESIGDLTNLTSLNLNGNQLTELPESIGNLMNLTSLSLSVNQLTEIPESIGDLTNLTFLGLYSNQLTEIPESIVNLINLNGLYLNGNQLTEIPESIGNLTNLTFLGLYSNQLTEIPESIGNLTNLTSLSLYTNQLTEIPESIGDLINLTSLVLSINQLTEIPESIGDLTNLTSLNLNGNQLTELPESIGNLINLTDVSLYNNQLTEIPESIGNLINLQYLELYSNQLTELPESICDLTNLISLKISYNQLSGSIPESIYDLTNLINLDLSYNELSGSISELIGNLINLRFLYLNGNQLSGEIPECLLNNENWGIWLKTNVIYQQDGYGFTNVD